MTDAPNYSSVHAINKDGIITLIIRETGVDQSGCLTTLDVEKSITIKDAKMLVHVLPEFIKQAERFTKEEKVQKIIKLKKELDALVSEVANYEFYEFYDAQTTETEIQQMKSIDSLRGKE